jgi:hypothetical protein
MTPEIILTILLLPLQILIVILLGQLLWEELHDENLKK